MTESPNKPEMWYVTKAILASHPNARIRATLDFILSTVRAAQDGKKILDIIENPGYIADGPEAQEHLNHIFAVIEKRFIELFGEELPK